VLASKLGIGGERERRGEKREMSLEKIGNCDDVSNKANKTPKQSCNGEYPLTITIK
jgi:hypothetical protein